MSDDHFRSDAIWTVDLSGHDVIKVGPTSYWVEYADGRREDLTFEQYLDLVLDKLAPKSGEVKG